MSSLGKDPYGIGEEALEVVFAISAELCLPRLDELHRTEEFRGFLASQNTGRAAPPPPLLDFVEVAIFFHEVSRGPSVSQTVCHHS